MCQLTTLLSSWLRWQLLLAGSATAMASTLSAAAPQSPDSRLSTPLLRHHVRTLKLNRHAGKRPPYTMRALRLLPARRG